MASPLVGVVEPRLYTPPLRPLNRRTSRGFEAIDFNRKAGTPFLPWQEWLSVHALELTPDGRYRFRIVLVLVARQNGKSTWKRGVTAYRMFLDDARLVVGIAQELSTAQDQWQQTLDTIEADPDLAAELDVVRKVNGQHSFRLHSGARYLIKASNRRAARGLARVAEVNFDELREQQRWDTWSAVSKTTTANPFGMLVAMSNAGDASSVVLNQLRDAALAGLDPSVGIFEFSAPDGCELDDPQAWREANPSLGYTISEDAIRTSLTTDPPAIFRTEVLCQRVDSIEDVVDAAAWKATADARGKLSDYDADRLAVCYEVAEDGNHATLVGATLMRDGRVRTAVIRAWKSAAAARAALPGILDKLEPGLIAWFPSGPTNAHATLFAGRENVLELTGRKQQAACQGLVDVVRARRLVHPGDPLQTAHVAGVRKILNTDGGFRFERLGGGHTDAAYATAGAVHAALVMPEPVRSNIRVMPA